MIVLVQIGRIQNHMFSVEEEPHYTIDVELVAYIIYEWPPLPIRVVNVIRIVVKDIWISHCGILYGS